MITKLGFTGRNFKSGCVASGAVKANRLNLSFGTVEGGLIFGAAAYETTALAVNFSAGRKVIPPLTDFLRAAAHDRRKRLIVWLLLGWLVDHVWRADPVPDTRSGPCPVSWPR